MAKIENIKEESETVETIKPPEVTDRKEIKKVTTSTKTIETSNESEKNQILFEEWKGCRSAITTYGDYVYNIRKYGFTVITGILSANTYFFVTFKDLEPLEKLSLSFILCLLILGLYITDTYYLVLVRGAVKRAKDLEKITDLELTTQIDKDARLGLIDTYSIIVYIVLIFASIIPSLILGIKNSILEIFLPSLVIIVGSISGIIYLHLQTIFNISSKEKDYKNREKVESKFKEFFEKAQKIPNDKKISKKDIAKAITEPREKGLTIMTRIFIDTNSLIQAIVFYKKENNLIICCVKNGYEIFISDHIMEESKRFFEEKNRKYKKIFKKFIKREELKIIEKNVYQNKIKKHENLLDKFDAHIIAGAEAANCTYLISENTDILRYKQTNLKIKSTSEFLKLME